jgi:anti-sigma regulatory factor (Ser/Thr protein kinase)
MIDSKLFFTKLLHAVFLLLFILVNQPVTSQPFYSPKTYNADSLLKILPEAQGKSRAETLMLLSGHYSLIKPDSAIYYAREAFDLSHTLKDKNLEIRSTVILGLVYHHKGNFPSAVRYGLDGERLAYEINDTSLIIQAVTYIALSYLYSGNDDLAIQKALALKHYLRNWNDPFLVFDLNIRLGWLYKMAKKYQEAIPYFRMCDSIAMKSAHIPAIFANLNINHLARCFRGVTLYDSALYHYHRLLGSEKNPDAPVFSYANHEVGMCHYLNGDYDSAEVYLNKSLKICKLEGDYVLSGISHLLAADLEQTQKQWIKAIGHYDEVIKAGEWVLEHRSSTANTDPHSEEYYVPEQHVPDYIETTGLNLLMKAHYNSYLIFSKLNNPGEALSHLERYNSAKNRQDSLQKKKDVLEIATRYETLHKEEDIIRLSREKELAHSRLIKTRNTLFVLLALMLLLIISAILLARQYRMKSIHETSLLKQKLFRAQMNPHFIFNALSSIQGIIMEKDHIRAATYLSRFAKLVRNILEGSLEEMVPLEKEIETIEHYLQLQEIRYSGHIGHSIYVDEELKERQIYMPPMLVQPFVENAIEHGLKHKPDKGLVKVSFELKGTYIEVSVSDNGIGRKHSGEIEMERKKNNTSLSTSLIVERLKTLNQGKSLFVKRKVNLVVNDLSDESGQAAGTMVMLRIPLVN